jgi:hypothetical protein
MQEHYHNHNIELAALKEDAERWRWMMSHLRGVKIEREAEYSHFSGMFNPSLITLIFNSDVNSHFTEEYRKVFIDAFDDMRKIKS